MMPRKPPVTVNAGARCHRSEAEQEEHDRHHREQEREYRGRPKGGDQHEDVVKMPQEIRNQPAAVPCSSAGTSGA